MSMDKRKWSAFIRALRVLMVRHFPHLQQDEEPATELILTVWKKSLLDDNWLEHLGPVSAVSLKCVDGSNYYEMDAASEMAEGLRHRNISVHAWGFHYCTDEMKARSEAEVAVTAAKRIGATSYHWNAEKQWANAGDPSGAAQVFGQTFKGLHPGCTLYANCFNDPVDEHMMEWFDVFEPMVYGTKAKTIATKFRNRMRRDDISPEKRGMMVGTGRLEKGRDDRAWGYFDDHAGSPGLQSLALEHNPVSLNFFRAGVADGEDVMTSGNAINPPLPNQIHLLRESLKNLPTT